MIGHDKRPACLNCGLRFNPKRKLQMYCSPSCRKRAWDKKQVIKLLVSILEDAIKNLPERRG